MVLAEERTKRREIHPIKGCGVPCSSALHGRCVRGSEPRTANGSRDGAGVPNARCQLSYAWLGSRHDPAIRNRCGPRLRSFSWPGVRGAANLADRIRLFVVQAPAPARIDSPDHTFACGHSNEKL